MDPHEEPYKPKILDLDEIDKISCITDRDIKLFEAAMMYVKAGFYVVPLDPNSKRLASKFVNGQQVNYGHASKNPKTIIRWFDPDEGVYKGHNIGLATGRSDGVFVLDLDVKDDANGVLTYEYILNEKKEEHIKCPVQSTPRGGKHLVMMWSESGHSSTGKIGDGIDTRGGTNPNACSAHIVAWPSTINSKEYIWETGGEVPPMPKFIADYLGVAWSDRKKAESPSGKKSKRGAENIDDEDVEEQVSITQIEEMLSFINPNDLSYDEWLKIGMAIHTQYPGEDGLNLWNSWSKHGDRYKKGECNIRWDKFQEEGVVRIASLFYFAIKGGWKRKPTDAKPNKISLMVEELNKELAVISVGGKLRYLVEKPMGMRSNDHAHYMLLSHADTVNYFKNKTINIEISGKTKAISQFTLWEGSNNRREYINGMGLYPDESKMPSGTYNTWRGFSVEPKPGECSLLLSHIKNILCDRNEFLYDYVLDWAADMFQDPGTPKGTCLVLRGNEGAGKGVFISHVLGSIISRHFIHLTNQYHLTGNFNALMSDALLVFADEVVYGGDKKHAGYLKALITERNIIIERKGVDAVQQKNNVRVAIASNEDWVVPAGVDPRRWVVLNVSKDKAKNEKYFNALFNEIDNGGREAFFHLMLNRKITNNLKEAPKTEGLRMQQAMTIEDKDSIVTWWIHCLERGRINLRSSDGSVVPWPEFVVPSSLYQAYLDWFETYKPERKPKSSYIFFLKILSWGIKKVRPYENGDRVRMYRIPPLDEAPGIFTGQTGMLLTLDHYVEGYEHDS